MNLYINKFNWGFDMNKKVILIATISLTLFLMIGAASAGDMFDFYGDNSNSENSDDTLVVGFNSLFPPFGYSDGNGGFTGFDLDLAKEVCRRNNWTFREQPIISWNTKEVELNSGEIDCIWSEFTINGRENDYTWSEPYFNNTMVFIVEKNSGIDSLDDLKGKNVEVLEGSSALNSLNGDNSTIKDGFASLTEIMEYDSGFMDLETGVCDALVADSGLAYYQVKENKNSKDFKILDEQLGGEQYGVGFKKGNTDLRDQVQKTLDEMYKDGTVEKIAQKYSEYHIPENVIYPNN